MSSIKGKVLVMKFLVLCSTLICVQGLNRNCVLRCNVRPTIFDYMRPFGCYCHSTCGGTLPCCPDKVELCDNKHACTIPKRVRSASHSGGDKLFYAKSESIVYECDFHHELVGSAKRTCIGNGIWIPAEPKCKYLLYVCRPPTIKNGDYSPKEKQYVMGDSITARCDPGYILQGSATMRCQRYTWTAGPSCIRDRCAAITYCSKDATCHNYEYYAKCKCNKGYTGDGYSCEKIPCFGLECKENQVCEESPLAANYDTCKCKEGFKEVGHNCIHDPCYNVTCAEEASCHAEDENEYSCLCNEGFVSNGSVCEKDMCFGMTCHEEATCKKSGEDEYSCVCKEGFTGDGKTCEEDSYISPAD